jgi:hypothetical protein
MLALILFVLAAVLAAIAAFFDTGRDDVLYALAVSLIAAGLAVQAYQAL